jgi:soluble lytic murein transglycosylase-like protein
MLFTRSLMRSILALHVFFAVAACSSQGDRMTRAPALSETNDDASDPLASASFDPPKDAAAAKKLLALTPEEWERARSLQKIIGPAAQARNIDPNLLNAIIKHESRFNPKARNPSGATGLMQLMPRTSRALAKQLGRANRPRDPDFSAQAGALLLRTLLDKFDQNLDLALFGFAQGSGSVRKWQKSGKRSYPPRINRFIRKIKRDRAAFEAAEFGAPASRRKSKS